MLFVCVVFCRPNVARQEKVLMNPQAVRKSNALFAFADDSPVSNSCPDGFQMDISGVCREVWYDEYDN